MLNTIKKPNPEFNLLHLEYGEILISSIKCYFFNYNVKEKNPFNLHLQSKEKKNRNYSQSTNIIKNNENENIEEMKNVEKNIEEEEKRIIYGKLHFTTINIIFQPQNIELPLLKLRYFKNGTFLRNVNILDINELDLFTANIDLKAVNQVENQLYKNKSKDNKENKDTRLSQTNITHLSQTNTNNLNKTSLTNNTNTINMTNINKSKKQVNKNPSNISNSMQRYEEKSPLHISLLNLAFDIEILLKKGENHFSLNTNLNNYIKDKEKEKEKDRDKESLSKLEIKLDALENDINQLIQSNLLSKAYQEVYNYFLDKGINPKYLFEALTNYLLTCINKDKDYISYSFLQLTTNLFKCISRDVYRPYYDCSINQDSFLFILEDNKSTLNRFKEINSYMMEGYLNNNDDINLLDNYINKIIVLKSKELEYEESKIYGNMNSTSPTIIDIKKTNSNNNSSSKENNFNKKNTNNNLKKENDKTSSFFEEVINKQKENHHIVIKDDIIIENQHINNDYSNKINSNLNVFKFYLFRLKVNRILPEGNQTGYFVIKNKLEINFLPITNNFKGKSHNIKLNKIKYLLIYRYLHQYKAIKIIMYGSSRDRLFEFESIKECNEVFNYLRENCVNLKTNYNNIKDMMNMWVYNLISNYDYIMYLNSIASRSFSDISQYPIFPWIFNNYNSDSLDLSSDKIYRDLSKPIGNISKKFEGCLEKFEHLKSSGQYAYHYGSHYSNPNIISHFLIRSHPSLTLNYEDGSFSKAEERIFKSIDELWQFILNNSTDVRELTPEFYCGEGDFLVNYCNIELKDFSKLSNVQLPKWANSVEEFMNVMKNGLESEYVSNNICHWIDLIFGYKQNGENAEMANNLFPIYSYEDYHDIKNIDSIVSIIK